jgi:hypothetical protein
MPELISYTAVGYLKSSADSGFDHEQTWELALSCSRCRALVEEYYTDTHTAWHNTISGDKNV